MENTPLHEIKFPLLGSLEDGESIEYIIWSIHSTYIEIAILNWLVNRSKLHKNDKVNLYIPQRLTEQYYFRKNVSGTVTEVTPYKEMQGEIYRISVDQLNPQEFTRELLVIETPIELLIQLIKDSMILKQGIQVYIKHLIPYFSRLVNYTNEEYTQIKKHILLDVKQHINQNTAKLQELHKILQTKLTKIEQIPIYIDLELLREILESEISGGLFHIIFTENNKISLHANKNDSFFMYINAIKNLEERLYSNYNQIVLLYLKSLKFLSNQS